MVRAEISDSEWKELRKLAIEIETPVTRIIGGLISDYLRANGHVVEGEKS